MREGFLRSTNIAGTVLLLMSIGLYIGGHQMCSDFGKTEILVRSFGIFGTILAASFFVVSLFHNRIDKIQDYVLSISVGYMLCYFNLVSSYQLLRGLRYKYFYGNLEERLVDIADAQIFYTLISHLPEIQQFFGWLLGLLSLLLLFRSSRRLAAIVLVPLLGANYIFNSTMGLCNSLATGLTFSMAAFLVIQQWEWFYNTVSNNPIAKAIYPFGNAKKYYHTTAWLKILLVSGVLVYTHYSHRNYNRYMQETPIAGVWHIVDYQKDESEDPQIDAFLHAESLFFEHGRTAFIKHQDSLTQFRYLFDSLHKQFDMYDFLEFRELDFKGKFDMLDNDTLLFYGKNNKDSISIKLIKDRNYDRTKK